MDCFHVQVGSKMAVDLSSPGGFSQDSVFGDLDCNDNTPVLQPQTLHAYSKVSGGNFCCSLYTLQSEEDHHHIIVANFKQGLCEFLYFGKVVDFS